MVKLLIGAVLILTASNALADNTFIYEDNNQQALTASDEVEGNVFIYENSNQSSSSDKFTKKVKVVYYNKEGKLESKLESKLQNISYGTSSDIDSASFVKSPYEALR
jgi:hypothetical protein